MRAKSTYPVLMLPVKMETRFIRVKALVGSPNSVRYELWVRVFPDQVFLNSFNPTLSNQEREDKKNYGKSTQLEDWKKLVDKYGQYRAAWIRDISDNEAKKSKVADDYIVDWLPDYFKLYLYWRDDKGALQPYEKSMSPIDTKNTLSLLSSPNNDWLTDFDAAEKRGLACRIECPSDALSYKKLEGDTFEYERIILVGLKRQDADPSSTLVETLLKSHQYTDGFSFLEYGTPSNNFKNEKSGFSSQERADATESFSHAVIGYESIDVPPPPFTTTNAELQALLGVENQILMTQNHGVKFASALGFMAKNFKNINRANEYNTPLGKMIQKATWFALGGQMLKMLFGDTIPNEVHQQIWDYYSKYVDARGPFPSIRIGKLPYGILPVFHIRSLLQPQKQQDIYTSGTTQDHINLLLAKLFEQWLGMAKSSRVRMIPSATAAIPNPDQVLEFFSDYVPRMEDISPENRSLELARILSMEPRSTEISMRIMELERVPSWYSNLVKTPNPLHVYPHYLIEEILKGKEEYKGEYSFAKTNFEEIEKLIQAQVAVQKIDLSTVKYAPVLSFYNYSENSLENLNTNASNKPPIPLISKNDWHLKEYLTLLKDIVSKPETEIPIFQGKHSVLVDWLLQGYAQTLELYHRNVYLDLGLEKARGASSYKVVKINFSQEAAVLKGQTVIILENTDTPKKVITIKAPFSGKIEEYYVNIGETIEKDLRLFRLKDEAKFKETKQRMVSLGAQIILEIERLKYKEEDVEEAQQSALIEAIDLNTYRLDAWLTGIAAQKIDGLRKGGTGNAPAPEGFYFGAYGWIEKLKINPAKINFEYVTLPKGKGRFIGNDLYDLDGGIIHCPSPAQAVAASIFRQSFSTYVPKKDTNGKVVGGSPYTLNISSDRVQKSKQMLDGLRQGQRMEALLGFRLERYLHQTKLDSLIYDLRKKYPLTVNKVIKGNNQQSGIPQLSVIDGLAILKSRLHPELKEPILQRGLDDLEEVLDGCTDLLTFEAGYQMTQGNFSQAAAAMDASKGAVLPPEIKSLNTPMPGSTQQHKLGVLLEAPKKVFDLKKNPKAYFEPCLEQWVSGLLGSFSKVGCKVKLYAQGSDAEILLSPGILVSLEELEIGALDFLFLAKGELNGSGTELEQRILKVAVQKYRTGPDASNSVISRFEFLEDTAVPLRWIGDLIEVAKYIKDLLQNVRSIKCEALATNNELKNANSGKTAFNYDLEYPRQLLSKIAESIQALQSSGTPMAVLAMYDIQEAQSISYDSEDATLKEARESAMQLAQKVKTFINSIDLTQNNYYQSIELIQEAVQMLFGKSFKLITPFIASSDFKAAIQSDQKLLVQADEFPLGNVNGGQERIRLWIEGRAAVDPKVISFSDFLSVTGTWSKDINTNTSIWDKHLFSIAQYTNSTTKNFPWINLNTSEIQLIRPDLKEIKYPSDAQSIVLFTPGLSVFNNPKQYGLMVDDYSEFVPRTVVDTGLAFQYNAPNNEAPQAWLLAAPSSTNDWEEDALKDIILDTLDLAKVRMVDLDAMNVFGNILPMTYWFNIPEYFKSPEAPDKKL